MKIALNMFSVRESMEKDPDKTIEEIAKMGYNWIEIYPGYAEDGLTPLTNGLHNPNRGAKEEKAWLLRHQGLRHALRRHHPRRPVYVRRDATLPCGAGHRERRLPRRLFLRS